MDVTEELSRGIIAKKGKGGAGNVSEDKKNRIISEAVTTWKRMGLSNEQIAFGIATMNIESGFNPEAHGHTKKSDEKGLGQFTDSTWQNAVNAYNRDQDKPEKEIDPSVLSNSGNASDQIKVMGRWIKEAWHYAEKFRDFLVGHPVSEDYRIKFIDIAYALWHGGVNVKRASKVNEIIRDILANEVNGRVMYYVDSKENATVPLSQQGEWYGGEFDPGGETNFGIYKDYLLMDSWAFGASHNRKLFLFRLGKDKVELLDVLVNAFPEKYEDLVWDFMTEAKDPNSVDRWHGNKPVWTDIGDWDGDGYPEVELAILRMRYEGNIDYDERIFDIYLEIKDGRLHVDLNPVLYAPLFRNEKAKYARRKKKSDAYYVYGFLSGELSLDKIRELLKGKEQYKSVVSMLEHPDKWDLAFREDTTDEASIPVLVREELKKK